MKCEACKNVYNPNCSCSTRVFEANPVGDSELRTIFYNRSSDLCSKLKKDMISEARSRINTITQAESQILSKTTLLLNLIQKKSQKLLTKLQDIKKCYTEFLLTKDFNSLCGKVLLNSSFNILSINLDKVEAELNQAFCDTFVETSALPTVSLRNNYQASSLTKIDLEAEGIFVEGHLGSITSVALSKDNTFIVTGSHDRTMRLWNLQTSSQCRIFTGHTEYVSCVAITSDNLTVISGSLDTTIRVVSLESGQDLVLAGHRANVTSLVLASDNKLIFSASKDRTIRQWNISNGIQVSIINDPSTSVKAFILANGEQDIIYISDSKPKRSSYQTLTSDVNTIYICSLRNNQQAAMFKFNSVCNSLVATNNNEFIVTGHRDSTVRIFGYASREQKVLMKGHNGEVELIGLTDDNKYIISVGEGMEIIIWRFEEKQMLRRFEGHRKEIRALSVLENKGFVTVSSDRMIKVWDLDSGKLNKVMSGHQQEVVKVAITHDGKFAVSGAKDRTVRVWDTKSKVQRMVFDQRSEVQEWIEYYQETLPVFEMIFGN